MLKSLRRCWGRTQMVGLSWWQGKEKGDRRNCSELQRSRVTEKLSGNQSGGQWRWFFLAPWDYKTRKIYYCWKQLWRAWWFWGKPCFFMMKKLKTLNKTLTIWKIFSAPKYGLLEEEESLWGNRIKIHMFSKEREIENGKG